jgi:uncharacterized protein YqeY
MTTDAPSLRLELNEAMKTAMRAKDSVRLGVIRMVLAAIKDRDIAGRTEDSREGINDGEIFVLMRKMIKMRRESAEAFAAAKREDLVAKELEEAAIIETFLPSQMDEAAMTTAIKAAIAELGATSLKDMGKVVALLRERHGGSMDMAKASGVLKSLLQL